MNSNESRPSCLLVATETRLFQPHAEDILSDEDLLDLFRIVKQVLRKKPDSDKLAKLLFCVSYALGDHVRFFKPLHEDKIIFRDEAAGAATNTVHAVRLPNNSSCCLNLPIDTATSTTGDVTTTNNNNNSNITATNNNNNNNNNNISSPSSVTPSVTSAPTPLTRLLTVPYLTNHSSLTSSSCSSSVPPHSSSSSTSDSASVSSPSSSSAVSQTIQPSSLHSLPPPTATLQQQLQQQQQQHLLNPSTTIASATSDLAIISSDDTSTDAYSVRPYTNFRPLYPAASPAIPIHSSFERSSNSSITDHHLQRYPSMPSTDTLPGFSDQHHHHRSTSLPHSEVLMEPKQRGFYYQDGRITREPVLLQRYAEQGILTQASLMRKRKRHSTDANVPFEMNQLPPPTKKPKIPHRHGEFEHRRDDIINRMRTITMQDLEQKAQRMPIDFALVIDRSSPIESLPTSTEGLTKEQAAGYLEPALRILTSHSNMKPHLDNGMNQNGIYYNSDYFRLYMAFEQFQKTFAHLFPNEVIKIPDDDFGGDILSTSTNATTGQGAGSPTNGERDKDRERNANMKAYRNWIEPLLTETNWAAFRRNIVVGERMMQLTKVVGQGVLLMTKELSGSKLHLTFTNNEWDEFITGLASGRWDQTIKWDAPETTNVPIKSRLVWELRQKFITVYWFHPDGTMVSVKDRKILYRSSLSSSSSSSSTSPTSPSFALSSSTTSSPIPGTMIMIPSTSSMNQHQHQHQSHHILPHQQQQQQQQGQGQDQEQGKPQRPHHHDQVQREIDNNSDPNSTNELPFHKVDVSLFGDMIR